MILNRKFWRLIVLPVLALAMVGCGGVTASRSISPASFLLPGFMKATPPVPPIEQAPPAEVSLELARN